MSKKPVIESKPEPKSKRQLIKEQRLKRQRQQRLATILTIAGISLLLAAFLIAPSIQRALTPVGDIVPVTPKEWPQADGTSLGDPNAPVRIEVWSDFQCPACRFFAEEIVPQVIETYVATNRARFVYRHFPFIDDASASRESDQAANASMCAAEQNRFWDYHDILFANWNGENAGAYADKRLEAFAENLGLNMDQFRACFRENRYRDAIEQDQQEGARMGVDGTPSVFVNGVQLTPGRVPSFDDIAQAVEAAAGN